MHLKSLTLRGFKSFASATTLRFEPGITAVVGPNGSGKSNVVDAIAWVLGEQGAKALRGGKMEDVIFAGTAGRAPLGRAEVTLTIDNSDGALPIDYAEVSITRRMFREGSSEYEINGESARLLDIQELLSDSGIGREMHVIVGQGQLDSVLQARPEDRRGFIEEAAGVLKHRKRKEKALRKLDAMQANLTRLTDLTAELRRQLKPLGKQAEIARRAAGVQAELRDSRLRLLADELTTLRAELARDVADEEQVLGRRAEVETATERARTEERTLEEELAERAPLLAATQQTWYRLSALQERFASMQALAADRVRLLTSEPEPELPGRDPDQLESEAARVRVEEERLQAALATAQRGLADAVTERQEAERSLADAERALMAATRAAADRREGLAKLGGQVNALRSRASASGDEIARLAAAAVEARERSARADAGLAELQAEVGELDEGELGLNQTHDEAVAARERAEVRARELADAERVAERDRSTWAARADALALGLTHKDGAGALLAAGSRLPGVLGSVAALLTVESGYEPALAAVLGAVADAVAVASATDAVSALEMLKADDAGRAGLLIGDAAATARADWPALPPDAVWAVDVVQAPAALRGTLRVILDRVAVVADLAAASSLVADHSRVRAVTRDGDVLARTYSAGGSAGGPSSIEIHAAVDEARDRAEEAEARHRRITTELAAARSHAAECAGRVETALSALHESDAQLSAVAERLAELAQRARAGIAEAERLERARAGAEEARDADLAGLSELEERLSLAEAASGEELAEPDAADRDARHAEVAAARQAEMEARLVVRTHEERVRAVAGRADALLRSAQAERAALARRREARAARARGAVIAREVSEVAAAVLTRLSGSLERAALERDDVARGHGDRERDLAAVRVRARELTDELARLTDAAHRDEVARAELRLRIESVEARAGDEYGVDVEALLAEYGPDQPCPPSSIELAEYEHARDRGEQVVAPQPGPFDRTTQQRRANRAERDLTLLGKVNPLALEEFAALEERHAFLNTQLDDLKKTRHDLLSVVKEVDERILQVFTSAYHDVAAEFRTVFDTLFPGGEGRLVLTDPDDMLMTGIEVEARPPGKKVKRLSLLSGGERSLTAVALLVAIFRARPSPFYVMDEVEAALDDVNLGRLISLIAELRSSSQLVVVTHQKRTMEIADALYGVTMRGDGVTQVISQRLTEAGAESA